MLIDYIGSIDDRHNLTKYTLSTGSVVILTEEEVEEFCQGIQANKILDNGDYEQEHLNKIQVKDKE